MKTEQKKKNRKKFLILLGITILDLIVGDPIPFLDEIILIGLTAYYGVKRR